MTEIPVSEKTLRDSFAEQALSYPRFIKAMTLGPKELAENCYEIADAMLKEREKYNDRN